MLIFFDSLPYAVIWEEPDFDTLKIPQGIRVFV